MNLEFDEMIAHAEERFLAEPEDVLDTVDPAEIRERLAQRGIVDGVLVALDALDNDPFIQQVVADAEAVEQEQTAVLAPPQAKPKREYVSFEALYPGIPKEQRNNFRITDPELGHGSVGQKYAANVAAIRMLKRIEDEGRLATPVEQEILSQYVGWGGLADSFAEKHHRYPELKALLSEEEFVDAPQGKAWLSPLLCHHWCHEPVCAPAACDCICHYCHGRSSHRGQQPVHLHFRYDPGCGYDPVGLGNCPGWPVPPVP